MNTRLTTLDLPSLHRNFIGIDRLLDRMSYNMNSASDGYPPYNIIKEDENTFVIEIAVAGIPREGIKINTHESILTVEATIEQLAGEKEKEYLHKGIAGRRFARTFNLAEHVEVESADVENGILSIKLVREVPEELKPRIIPINFG